MGSLGFTSDSYQCPVLDFESNAEENYTSPKTEMNDCLANSTRVFKKKKNQVFLQGYVETNDNDEDDYDIDNDDDQKLGRSKSLTDDDLEELKGCLDLGFGFSYDEIPELCNTLPALELCYSLSQKFLDDQQQHKSSHSSSTLPLLDSPSPPIANWKISSPGDDPEDVKARLKFWAQAVACTVKLCN